jgi:hypothetical protein
MYEKHEFVPGKTYTAIDKRGNATGYVQILHRSAKYITYKAGDFTGRARVDAVDGRESGFVCSGFLSASNMLSCKS